MYPHPISPEWYRRSARAIERSDILRGSWRLIQPVKLLKECHHLGVLTHEVEQPIDKAHQVSLHGHLFVFRQILLLMDNLIGSFLGHLTAEECADNTSIQYGSVLQRPEE